MAALSARWRTMPAGAAAASYLLTPGQATVTAQYRISFLSPAIGDVLIARGDVIKPGRSIIHTKCDVTVRAGDRETLVTTACLRWCHSRCLSASDFTT